LEKSGATGLERSAVASRPDWIGPAKRRVVFLGGCWGPLFGQPVLVSLEQSLQDSYGVAKVIAERHEQIDVVEVFRAVETVGEVVAWIDGGAHFAAVRAEKAEVAFAHFGGRPVATEGGDGDGHGEVVANSAQQIGVDHALLRVGV
jgi:hypothetical protein